MIDTFDKNTGFILPIKSNIKQWPEINNPGQEMLAKIET